VGLGRAARKRNNVQDAKSLQAFKDIRRWFLIKRHITTGDFKVAGFSFTAVTEQEFKQVAYSLEKFSNHPVAKPIVRNGKLKTR
jgi:Cu+-exporting ATPase